MAIIKCKMCGGDIELPADKTFGTCECFGSTMTLPKISDDQRAAAFNRGNQFRRMGDFDKALAVYEHIVQEDDNDAENAENRNLQKSETMSSSVRMNRITTCQTGKKKSSGSFSRKRTGSSLSSANMHLTGSTTIHPQRISPGKSAACAAG